MNYLELENKDIDILLVQHLNSGFCLIYFNMYQTSAAVLWNSTTSSIESIYYGLDERTVDINHLNYCISFKIIDK